MPLSRRDALAALAATAVDPLAAVGPPPPLSLATFSAEITCPLGHPLMGGGIAPAKKVEGPLFGHGLVLLGAGRPIVLAVLDWCEVRNDAYSAWREALAKAAGTTPGRVLVSCIHQHDAPIADLAAEKLLRDAKARGSICDPAFHEKAVARVARALGKAIRSPRRVTHVGTGAARVEQVASNRRYLDAAGKPAFGRTSATRDEYVRKQPEGTIDPMLKVLSFWEGGKALAAVSCYATHPMSYYGRGGVSADFVGMARSRRQADLPGVLQIYASGASGNVTAGKYNDGAEAKRAALAGRIHKAMAAAWQAMKLQSVTAVGFRSVPYELKPRDDAGFSVKELTDRLKNDRRPFGQCLAALGLSWRQRCDAGRKLDLPVIELGNARLALLPGESYIEFQLAAQKLRPDLFVMTLGYGECGPGYVPTEKAVKEKDTNLHDWCWVAPGAEQVLTATLRRALGKG